MLSNVEPLLIFLPNDFTLVSPDSDDVVFNISRISGVLTVSGTLDRETVSRFIISVKVCSHGDVFQGFMWAQSLLY